MFQDRSFRCVAAVLALALLAGGAAHAAKDAQKGADEKNPALVDAWLNRLDGAEERLRAGDYRKAYKVADVLEEEMLDRIESGPGVGPLLSRTLVARSLAGAGLGRMRDATWDWFMARALNPELTDETLAQLGKEGQALAEAIAKLPEKRKLAEIPPGATVTTSSGDTSTTGVLRPKRLGGDNPQYPYALREACAEGVVMVEGVIDEEEGLIHRPATLQSPNPLLALATMESLRTWRFAPASSEGKPVPVDYTITINYTIQQCRGAQRWKRR
jgi:hypothetical protein